MRQDPTGKREERSTTIESSLDMAVPAQDDPIEILRHEHDEGLRYLGMLDDAAVSIQRDGFSGVAFERIAEAIRFIGIEVRNHNEKEEKYLFPLLDRHMSAPPEAMRHEHRELWRGFNDLTKAVKDVEDGRIHGTSIRELLQTTHFVVEHLRSHITKENVVLFPMAKRLLTPSEYDELRKAIATASKR